MVVTEVREDHLETYRSPSVVAVRSQSIPLQAAVLSPAFKLLQSQEPVEMVPVVHLLRVVMGVLEVTQVVKARTSPSKVVEKFL
tara:strand:- start:1265 stop:1516 length:252 start_codon:yes stop_codon:yes gene_type:complete